MNITVIKDIFDRKLILEITFHVTIVLIYNFLSGYLVHHITEESLGDQNKIPINFITFLLAVIVFPLIETLIFQLLPYSILILMNVSDRKIIIISGILFGLNHFFSPSYIFVSSIVGAYFAYLLIRFNKKYDLKVAFYLVTFVHCLMNLIVFSLKAYKEFFL